MSLKATDLKPGDRVRLNCPKARVRPKRQAVFEGIFQTIEEAMGEGAIVLDGASTSESLTGGAWARFLMARSDAPVVRVRHPDQQSTSDFRNFGGGVELVAAFRIEPDGSLREQEGRRVFIEQRLSMGRG